MQTADLFARRRCYSTLLSGTAFANSQHKRMPTTCGGDLALIERGRVSIKRERDCKAWRRRAGSLRNTVGFGAPTLFVFVAVQCTDAWLTAIGIDRFGSAVEANPILAWYVTAFGAGIALVSAKAIAVGCAAALYAHACHRTLSALTLLYLIFAIIPWMLALHW